MGLTSVIFQNSKDTMTVVLSHNERKKWRIDCPVIPGKFTGTGDLCTALFLAWTERHPDDLGLALTKVVGTMYAVIRRTVGSKELKLIASKSDIENPPLTFPARRLE